MTHTNAQLTAEAVRRLNPYGGFSPADIELLACGTSSPDQLMPGHAVMVHGELGGAPLETVSTAGICMAGMGAFKYACLSVEAGQTANAVATGSELASTFFRANLFASMGGEIAEAPATGSVGRFFSKLVPWSSGAKRTKTKEVLLLAAARANDPIGPVGKPGRWPGPDGSTPASYGTLRPDQTERFWGNRGLCFQLEPAMLGNPGADTPTAATHGGMIASNSSSRVAPPTDRRNHGCHPGPIGCRSSAVAVSSMVSDSGCSSNRCRAEPAKGHGAAKCHSISVSDTPLHSPVKP